MNIRISLFLAVAVANLVCPAQAQQEATSLWPKGQAPYFNAEIDAGRPKIIAYPALEENRNGAAIVVCPGGGYGGLAADHEGHQIAQFFNDLGVSAYVLHYRLGGKGYHYPAQLADVQRALRHVRHLAADDAHFIDADCIGVIGFSAGGHLASMAATLFDRKAYPLDRNDPVDGLSARPDFAVLCYPVISMEDGVTHEGSRRNLSGEKNPDDKSSKILSLSSEYNVTARTPPTFLFHTGEDTVVPVENPIRFYQALRKNNIPAEMHLYERGPHGVGLYRGDPSTGTWSQHLVTWLRNRGVFAPAEKMQRVAVQGEITLDGEPVSWGSIAFLPEDQNLPFTALRIRGGKFSADATTGPVVGVSKISFEASIWELTQNPADRVIQTDRLSQNETEPLSLEVKASARLPASSEAHPTPVKLQFAIESRTPTP